MQRRLRSEVPPSCPVKANSQNIYIFQLGLLSAYTDLRFTHTELLIFHIVALQKPHKISCIFYVTLQNKSKQIKDFKNFNILISFFFFF